MRKLIDYLPLRVQLFRETRATMLAEQPEINSLWNYLDNALKDQFVVDSTENGVSRWEQILRITPKATATLDERKFTVLTRINEQLPFTLRSLENQLTTLCGEDGYKVELDADNYVVTVKIALTAKSMFNDVDAMLKRILPANLEVIQQLLYNQYQTLAQFTHEQLSKWTHEQLRNEVLL